MTPVGFEPMQLALVELESTPLDHSGKVSWCIDRSIFLCALRVFVTHQRIDLGRSARVWYFTVARAETPNAVSHQWSSFAFDATASAKPWRSPWCFQPGGCSTLAGDHMQPQWCRSTQHCHGHQRWRSELHNDDRRSTITIVTHPVCRASIDQLFHSNGTPVVSGHRSPIAR